MTYTRYVIHAPVAGVFIGYGHGLCFWSNFDAAYQPAAVAFALEEDAEKVIKVFQLPDHMKEEIRIVAVETADPRCASIIECVNAGLPGWSCG